MRRDHDSIGIDRVQTHEVDALLGLYVDLFHDREPLTKCFGFSRERMISIARALYDGTHTDVLARGICWVARDRAAANREVGFILADDPAAAGGDRMPDNLTDDERERLPTVMSLLVEIRRPVKDRLASDPGTCLHVSAVGVAPGYEGAGLGTRLLQTALAEAEARGFLHAFAECTSPASRVLHEKSGFTPVHSVPVNGFFVDGRHPFEACHLEVHLMWKVFDGATLTSRVAIGNPVV